jgi:hypothetical protein
MIYRLLYIDKKDRIHSKRYAEAVKEDAFADFKAIRKNETVSVRTETLNDYGELISAKEFGPKCDWVECLYHRITLRKLYFAYAFTNRDFPEEIACLTEQEAEKIIRDSVGEPGYGTEWVWCPKFEEY